MPRTKKTPGLPKNGQPTKVYLVLHCEVWQTKPNLLIDDMPSHVASSLEKAEAYIKEIYIFDDAYWKIAEYTVDNPDPDGDCLADQSPLVRYYGNKGKPLKTITMARLNKAIREFEKENPKGYKE